MNQVIDNLPAGLVIRVAAVDGVAEAAAEGGADDVAAIAALYNHYVAHSVATFDIRPVTVDNRRQWMRQFDNPAHRLLTAWQGDTLAGYACSSRLRPKPAYGTSVETTVYVAADMGGRGIGGHLYAALFAAIAGAGLHRAFAAIVLPNEASLALHRRFGFRECGVFAEAGFKFGRYHDVQWMQKDLS